MTFLLQRLFTLSTHKKFSPKQSMGFAKVSVSICQQLGIHGRVLSNDVEALFIIEGTEDLIKKYYDAVLKDPHTDLAVIHSDLKVATFEFSDYSVWLSSYNPDKYDYGPSVHLLTSKTLSSAIPENLSFNLSIRIDALIPTIA